MNKHEGAPMDEDQARGSWDIGSVFEADHIWSRPGLARPDRHIAAITTALVQGSLPDLKLCVEQAMAEAIEPETIGECVVHTSLYTGTRRMQEGLNLLIALADPHCLYSPAPIPKQITQTMRDAGTRIKDQLHGVRKDSGHANPQNRFTSPLYDLATDVGYGHIWVRPGLSLRQRLICAVAAFAALPGAEPSFRKFAQSATNNGVEVLEIQEIVIQAVPHIGFPRALKALMIMEDLF